MKELNFDTGLVTYSINGKYELTFNPTDSAFVERFFSAFNTLDSKRGEYEERVNGAANAEIFAVSRELDAEMREIINSVFETDVCSALFGDMNVFALAGGLPVWANLFFAVMDELDSSFAAQQKLTNPRIAKYTSKYHK